MHCKRKNNNIVFLREFCFVKIDGRKRYCFVDIYFKTLILIGGVCN